MILNPPIRLREAAALLDCPFEGNPEMMILGINEIHRVGPGDLSFVDVEKYYAKAFASAASVLLIDRQVEKPEDKGLIVSENPFRDFNRLLEYAQPRLPLDTQGAPALGPGVRLGQQVSFGHDVHVGEGSEIGSQVCIGSGVRIGKHCRIYPRVTILDHCVLGDHVTVNAGTVIGSEAFYFKSRPWGREKLLSKGRVVIGNHVDIGANCTLDRGATHDTVIGDWTKLDNLVQVGHDTVIGERCLIAAQVGIAGVVRIEDGVVLWGQVGVNKDLTIGKGAVLYGKTGVMSSLEGGKTYLGMVATEARQKLRELAALKRLPDLLRRWEREEPE
jgi:UDP-3-O-[3-hydroxymyristoyl] glucosamine N-acyltransferase